LVVGFTFLLGGVGQDLQDLQKEFQEIEGDVETVWSALWNFRFKSSWEDGWKLWQEATEEERLEALAFAENPDILDNYLAGNGTDDTNSSGNGTNSSGNGTATSPTMVHIQAITKVIISPIVLFVGQDVEQLLHVLNGLMVGGISAVATKLSSLEKFDPMVVVDIGSMLTAAAGAIASTLQNPSMGAVVQGGVIFKQLSTQVVKMTYLKAMEDLGGCESINWKKITPKYPHGVPEGCNKKYPPIPFVGEIHGEDLGLYVMTAVEYGLVAIGAYISPYLAIIMCIFNAASVGGHMLLDSVQTLMLWLMPKMGFSEKKINAAKMILDGGALKIWMGLVGAGFLAQLLARIFRHKGAGHGPFKHLKFTATEARGGGDPWASISELNLMEHKIALEIPHDYEDPPEQGKKSWIIVFESPQNMTKFCFMTGGKESKVEDDPVSFTVYVSESKSEEPLPEDDPSWLIINESKQVKVPKARNARSDLFRFEAPKAPEPEKGALAGAAAAVAGAAAGAAAAASGAASAAAGGAEAAAKEAADEAKGYFSKMKLKVLRLKYNVQHIKPQVEEKIQFVKKFVKDKMAFGKKMMGKGQEVVKMFMAPFSVLNHVVRESTDKTAGKDPKGRAQIVAEALHGLGWEEPMLKRVMQQTLNMLMAKMEVGKDIIEKIVGSTNEEELQQFFIHACNQEFGSFVKDLEDVLRKMIEEEKETMEAIIGPIKAHLDVALREFYMGEAALVISKAFYTTPLEARLYLLTLQDITRPDGSIACAGRFKDLDDKDEYESNDIKLLNAYLEKLASGKAFPGRTQHVAKMKEWLKEDEEHLQNHVKREMGFVGTMMVRAQPYVKMYPTVMKNYTMFKSDPKGTAMGIAAPYKDMLVKKVSDKISEYKKKVTDTAMAKVADVEGQAKAAASDAMGQAAKLQEQATDAALKAAGSAANAAEGAAEAAGKGGLDLEAQASAAKSLVPEAKHGAIEDSDAPFVAMPDGPQNAPDASKDEYHDLMAAMVEQKANKEMCIEEMHKKLGLTIEEAKRLANYMTDEQRAHAAACGGMTLPEVMKLAERFGVHFNKEKAEEQQQLVQAHKVKKELAAAAPPFERKKAHKKAKNMTPNDINSRMTKPATHRPKDPAAMDMKKTVKDLKKTIDKQKKETEKLKEAEKKLKEELKEAKKKLGEAEAELEAEESKLEEATKIEPVPDADPREPLKKILEARADPAQALSQDQVKSLLAARINPQERLAMKVIDMIKGLPKEALDGVGATSSTPQSEVMEKIIKGSMSSGGAEAPQQMMDEVVKQLLAEDDVKAVLG